MRDCIIIVNIALCRQIATNHLAKYRHLFAIKAITQVRAMRWDAGSCARSTRSSRHWALPALAVCIEMIFGHDEQRYAPGSFRSAGWSGKAPE